MPTRATFQNLANKLINNTFADFRDVVTFSLVGEFDYDTQVETITSTDTTKGIRLEFSKTQFTNSNIEIGDYKIVLEQQPVTIDIRADNVNMTFNSKNVEIIQVEEDAARAAYTIHVRDK